MKRCTWCGTDPLYQQYHDHEWGVPSHDDTHLFEMLILEGAQAGLSWITILKKRENYRAALDHFDPDIISRYNKRKLESLLKNEGIVRNRLKLEATIQNARAYLEVKDEQESFSDFLWQFTDGKVITNRWRSLKEIPASTDQSDRMSKELRKRGFKFVGSTICYAFMQAVGMVNDHTTDCFRYKEVKKLAGKK